MSVWRTGLKMGLFVVPVTFTFTDVIASLSQVVGVSMQPLLNPDYDKGKTDWVLQNRMAVANHNLNRGDIVTFITPYDPKQLAVKRIIGLQGDSVRSKKDRHVRTMVPVNHVWVEGDNSEYSHDSNNYGPISMSLITSKATHVVWPPSRWQKLDSVEINSDRVLKNIHDRTCKNSPF
ncbi:mitochondrial inner membrane protease subunit 2-like [Mercenaria mercenaria]|uniref:mitochondrial inner membrane protease subunit 2-like n=1 Tax=Mercenaria mercenaria TaxID=6596 RepID=UPI001E1D88EF|nr:mitochondrial inner membrane protease subunit 2-like [Mercenaria mercenaria]